MSDIESEPDSNYDRFYVPSYYIIALDSSQLNIKEALNACHKLADSLLFNNTKTWSPFSICTTHPDPNASILTNFSTNMLETIKILENKAEDDQKSTNFDFGAFLSKRLRQFSEIKGDFKRKILIYVTNNDNPIAGDTNRRFAALNTFKLMKENGIEFELVTFKPDFNYETFYNNELYSLLGKTDEIEEIVVEDGEALYARLADCIKNAYSVQKTRFYLDVAEPRRFLVLSEFYVTKEKKVYSNAQRTIDGEAVIKTRTFVDEKGEESSIPQHDRILIKNINLDGLEIEKEEYLAARQTNAPTGYTFVGVGNPLNQYGLTHSSLKYVKVHNEEENCKIFAEIWQYCTNKDKVLVCVRNKRKNDKIAHVELIPMVVNGERVFLVKKMANMHEFRFRPTKAIGFNMEKISDGEDLMAKFVDCMDFDFRVGDFSDPLLGKKMAFLKGKFLDQPIETIRDDGIDWAGIAAKVKPVAAELAATFDWGCKVEVGKKRKQPTKPKVPAKKGKTS